MKHRSNHRGQWQLLAAAVALALGSASAFGQQESSEQQAEQPSPGISQTERESQQSSETQTAAAGQQSSGSQQLDQIAEENEDLSTFVEAVRAAGMEDSLTDGTEYTLFAPTNDAFEQMSGLSTEELLMPENRQQLIDVLRAHIVADDVDEQLARSLPQAQTIDGGTVELSAGEQEDELMVGDANVVESGIQAGSLRVYAIDSVLARDTSLAQAEPQFGEEQESEQPQPGERESDPFSDPQRSEQPGAQPQSERPGGEPQIGQPPQPGQPQLPEESETTPR